MKAVGYIRQLVAVGPRSYPDPDAQVQAIQEYCTARKLQLVRIYSESHPYFSVERRPVLGELLAALSQGQAEYALVLPRKVDSSLPLASQVEARLCGHLRCQPPHNRPVCRFGAIQDPELCAFA